MNLTVFTSGGTFDKIYHDALSEFKIGDPMVPILLQEAGVNFDYQLEVLLKKDSLELTDADRNLLHQRISHCPSSHILLTHGTDTMSETAEHLLDIKNKVIVLTGAMQPARMRSSDAAFNLGVAIGALQTLTAGVYIAMNGCIFEAGSVKKNHSAGRFENKS